MLTARIAVVVSGGGTNLQALIDAQGRGVLQSGSIALVVADRAGIGAIARAEKAGIPCVTIVRKEAGFEEGVLSAFREHGIDMAVLAGFLGIFSADFIRRFSGPIINTQRDITAYHTDTCLYKFVAALSIVVRNGNSPDVHQKMSG